MFLEPLLGALRDDFDVGEIESGDDGFDEAGFFLCGVEEGEFCLGKCDGERNAGESGSCAGVGDALRVFEEAPGEERIEDVFDGGLAGIGDAGEVHHLVDLDDHFEMAGGFLDDVGAIGEILREERG